MQAWALGAFWVLTTLQQGGAVHPGPHSPTGGTEHLFVSWVGKYLYEGAPQSKRGAFKNENFPGGVTKKSKMVFHTRRWHFTC